MNTAERTAECLVDNSAKCWLGRQDSNLRMPVPKTGALPLGDAPAEGALIAWLAGMKRGDLTCMAPLLNRLQVALGRSQQFRRKAVEIAGLVPL